MPLEYPGLGRLAYFLSVFGISIVFYAILFVVVFASFRASSASGASNGGAGMGVGLLLVGLLFFAVSLFLAVRRVTNLGMSRWAVLWSLVPVMNVWIYWRMMACPAGYEDHRTLDTAGKVITGVWIGFMALAFLAPLIGAFAGR